jgi:hypothetical protein
MPMVRMNKSIRHSQRPERFRYYFANIENSARKRNSITSDVNSVSNKVEVVASYAIRVDLCQYAVCAADLTKVRHDAFAHKVCGNRRSVNSISSPAARHHHHGPHPIATGFPRETERLIEGSRWAKILFNGKIFDVVLIQNSVGLEVLLGPSEW